MRVRGSGQVVNLLDESNVRLYRHVALALLAVNLLSAVLFIFLVPRPVYDDSRILLDARRYAAVGITSASVRTQINPMGPGSFIWMSLGARLLGGRVLLGGRLAVLASGLLLGFGMLWLARCCAYPELLYGSLIVTLVFPHTMTCVSTLMTEVPAMFFGLLGAMAWLIAVTREELGPREIVFALFGGLFMGIAVTCRQYFLALLPAAALFACIQFPRVAKERRRGWLTVVVASLAFAALPVIALVIEWRGISTPGMASGAYYKRWHTSLAPNLARPFVALFAIAGYLALLTFPLVRRVGWRLALAIPSAVFGLVIAYFRAELLQPGPLRSLVRFAGRLRHADFVLMAVIAALIIYNLLALLVILWRERAALAMQPAVAFSLLVLIFFVLEQSGVGGNLPFYDRYVLQVAPFLAIVTFWMLPKLDQARGIVLLSLLGLSHVLLWRNAFAP